MPLTIKHIYAYVTLIVGACFMCFISCGRPSPLDTPINFLGHKGGGSNNYNDVYIENTLPIVQSAFDRLDGAELDIQMSLDGTPWIWHNSSLDGYICDNSSREDTIPKMRDVDIEKIKICHKNKSDRIYKLSEIVNWSNTTPDGIYISLDIKISFSKNTFSLYGDRNGYLIQLATSLATVFENYKFTKKTLAEIDSQLFCTTLKSFSSTKDIVTCFMRYEPMENKIKNAVKLGYDGLSCNYTDASVTKETIEAAHRAGLKVQLWTPYYRDELRVAFAMNPDFIQTDNIYAKQALNVR